MVPQWKLLYAHKLISAESSISISLPAAWLLFFYSLTPFLFSHSLASLLTFLILFSHLQIKPISTVPICDRGLSPFLLCLSLVLYFPISERDNWEGRWCVTVAIFRSSVSKINIDTMSILPGAIWLCVMCIYFITWGWGSFS